MSNQDTCILIWYMELFQYTLGLICNFCFQTDLGLSRLLECGQPQTEGRAMPNVGGKWEEGVQSRSQSGSFMGDPKLIVVANLYSTTIRTKHNRNRIHVFNLVHFE